MSNAGNGSRPDLAYANPDWLDTDHLVVAGDGAVVATNVTVGSNVVDHVLLGGNYGQNTVTLHSDYNQVVRASWVDENDDIVFAEFTGPGNLKITLENSSGPAAPTNYNQSVNYMKGRAQFQITGSTSSTYFNVYTVGTSNTSNQSIFKSITYDGIADVKNLTFLDATAIGGILNGNAIYRGNSDVVGILSGPAVLVKVTNKLVVRDIRADSSSATAALILSPSSQFVDTNGRPTIAGGNLNPYTNAKLYVRDGFTPGFQALTTSDNYNTHGVYIGAQSLINARLAQQYTTTIIQMPVYNTAGSQTGSTSSN